MVSGARLIIISRMPHLSGYDEGASTAPGINFRMPAPLKEIPGSDESS